MGTVVEVLSDEKGLIWPSSIAPFHIHLISIEDKSGKVKSEADKLYDRLLEKGIEVLYDDRDMRAGEKFAQSELIGIPKRVVISEKTLESDSIEIKERNSEKTEIISINNFLENL
jgi:prolyl-tRNA synthetase